MERQVQWQDKINGNRSSMARQVPLQDKFNGKTSSKARQVQWQDKFNSQTSSMARQVVPLQTFLRKVFLAGKLDEINALWGRILPVVVFNKEIETRWY